MSNKPNFKTFVNVDESNNKIEIHTSNSVFIIDYLYTFDCIYVSTFDKKESSLQITPTGTNSIQIKEIKY